MLGPLVRLYLTLVTLKVNIKVIQIRISISRKGVELGHALLLNTNNKSHSPTPQSGLTLSHFERSKSRSLRVGRRIFRE